MACSAGVARQALRRHAARDVVGVVRAIQREQRIRQFARGAGSLRVHVQQVAQRAFPRGHVAAQVREVRARLQRRRVIGPQLVEHGIGAPCGIGIAQVAGGRELVQHHVVAGVALELGERRVLPHGRAGRIEMLEREPRIAAPDGQYREPGLRLRMARGRSGDLAEMQRRERLDAEVEAEIAERRLEARPLVLGECLEGLVALDARSSRGARRRGRRRPVARTQA